jgi:Pretoxin HINT domain
MKVGDAVVSRDERTGENHLSKVTDLLRHSSGEGTLWLTLGNVPDAPWPLLLADAGAIESIGVTPAHPLHVVDRGWIMARDLRQGDRIDGLSGPLQVLELRMDLRTQEVYNISVESDATYFVGEFGAWVHNSKGGKGKGGKVRPNDKQNKEFKDALLEIGSRLGCPVSKKDQRRLHDEVTGQDYTFQDIVDIGIDIFTK